MRISKTKLNKMFRQQTEEMLGFTTMSEAILDRPWFLKIG